LISEVVDSYKQMAIVRVRAWCRWWNDRI